MFHSLSWLQSQQLCRVNQGPVPTTPYARCSTQGEYHVWHRKSASIPSSASCLGHDRNRDVISLHVLEWGRGKEGRLTLTAQNKTGRILSKSQTSLSKLCSPLLRVANHSARPTEQWDNTTEWVGDSSTMCKALSWTVNSLVICMLY